MALSGGSGGSGGAAGIMAGQAYVKLFVKNELSKGLNSAAKQFNDFGKWVGRVGATMAKAGAAGGAGLGAIFAASVSRSAGFETLSQRLGDSAEALSSFAYAAETTKIPLEQLLDDFENWPERLVQAAGGAGEAAEAFKLLGIDAAKMAGLPLTEQMIGLADAMQKVGNDTQRLQILGQLFSDKGQGLSELFKMGGGGIRNLMAQAGQVGATVTTQQAKQARDIEKTFGKAWATIKAAVLSVGDALIPQSDAIAAIGEQAAAAAGAFRGWVTANKDVVLGLGLAFGGLTAVGLGLMVLGPAIAAVGAAWTVFTGVFSAGAAVITAAEAAITMPIVAIPAALVAAGVAWLSFTDKGRAAAGGIGDAVKGMFGETLKNVSASWGTITDAVGRGDLQAALGVAFATIDVEWKRLCINMKNAWGDAMHWMDKQAEEPVIGALEAMGRGMERGVEGGAGRLLAFGDAIDAVQGVFEKGNPAARFEEWFNQQMERELIVAQQRLDDDAPRAALIAHQKNPEEKALDEAKKKLEALRMASDLKGIAAGWKNWLTGGLGEAARLLGGGAGGDLAGRVTDLQNRSAWAGDVDKRTFGQGGGGTEKLLKDANELQKEANAKLEGMLQRLGAFTWS